LSTKANKVGINEIANALGISKSTVSRALNNHPKISEATKQKVLKQAQQLGYQPNIPDLISNKESRSVALIIPHSESTYFKDIIAAVRLVCQQNDFGLFVCQSAYDLQEERRCINQIKALDFSALVYVSHTNSHQVEELDYLIKQGFPISVIHHNQLKNPVSTVILDVHQSFHDSIEHLKNNGAQKIGLVISEKENALNAQINSLFEEMLAKMDLEYDSSLVFLNSYKEDKLNRVLSQIFSENNYPDALIFSSYNQAFKAWQYINSLKLDTGKVLIMSIDSSDLRDYAKPNISYLQLQGSKLGSKAARLVFEQITKPTKASTKVYFSRLIIKSSSLKV
jgi:LacI family transcriptional regulator